MPVPTRTIRSSHALRAFAVVLSVWLWALPQVMYSKVIVDLFMEQGSCPLPIIEEEEVKQAGMEPPVSLKATSGSGPRIIQVPKETDRPHQSLHGEVPHLPPWC